MRRMYLTTGEVDKIKVQSNTRVVLRKGSIITYSCPNEDKGVLRRIENKSSMFYASNASDIEIVGESDEIINGCGNLLINEREESLFGIIMLVNCNNIKIKNLTLINSLYWGILLDNCENVEIENVKIVSKWGRSNSGIELASCRNVHISNCVIDIGDTCIVLRSPTVRLTQNIIVEKCVFSSVWSSFRIGTDSVGDFNDIVLRDCTVRRAEGCFLKINPIDGGNVNNLLVENINLEYSTGPIFIANGMRNWHKIDDTNTTFSSITGVTLRKINANVYISYSSLSDGVGDCLLISGNKKRKIKNVVIEDCVLNMPGGKNDKIEFGVSELEDQYPEYYILGIAPASGIFIRHAEDVIIKNVKVNLKDIDCREKIVLEDVTESKIY